MTAKIAPLSKYAVKQKLRALKYSVATDMNMSPQQIDAIFAGWLAENTQAFAPRTHSEWNAAQLFWLQNVAGRRLSGAGSNASRSSASTA